MFQLPPAAAAWRHADAQDAFESVFVRIIAAGYEIDDHTAGVEAGVVWAVRASITLDSGWMTRAAQVWGQSPAGARTARVETDGAGHWHVDGEARPELDGCFDLDLESSACTNAFPVHRLQLAIGETASAPAAYVRADNLRVERLEQSYRRVDDREYDYESPAADFRCRLVFDASGFVLDYPGIATRVV